MLAQLTRTSALETRIQGDRNRSTPEWASTHPLEPEPGDPGRANGAADRAGGQRPSQSRRIPGAARRRDGRRRSGAGRDRGAELHPSRPSPAVHRPDRLSDAERHPRGDDRGFGREGAIFRRPFPRQHGRLHRPGAPAADRRQGAACARPAPADQRQRHSGDLCRGTRQHLIGRRSMSASSPISGMRTRFIIS